MGVEDGEGPDMKRDREGLSGENKPFAALIESLAALPSRQGRRLFTTWPLKDLLFWDNFISIIMDSNWNGTGFH